MLAATYPIVTLALASIALMGATPARAEDGCAVIARLHAAGLAHVTRGEQLRDLPNRIVPPVRAPESVGECWTASDGAAWGLVLDNIIASASDYEEGELLLSGDIIAIRVAPDGTVLRQAVGEFLDGPSCDTEVRAHLVEPPGGLVVEANGRCKESGGGPSAHLLIARGGALTEPGATLAPLVLGGDDGWTLYSQRHFRVDLPGGPGGYYTRSFPIPYRVAADGALILDTDVLAAACNGLVWRDIDVADPETENEKLIASFACDWFRGVKLGPAIQRARRICPSVPKREPDEETDEYELRVSNVEYESPTICHVADRFLAIAKTKPPHLLPRRTPPKTPTDKAR